MIGYKALSDFTFDDCINHIERCKSTGMYPDAEIRDLYYKKLSELNKEDNDLFNVSKNSRKGCKIYLKHFPIEGAKLYKPLHTQEINKIIQERKKKRLHRRIYATISISLFAAILVCYLNYSSGPVLHNLPHELNVSQYGDTLDIRSLLNLDDNENEQIKIWLADIPICQSDSAVMENIEYRNCQSHEDSVLGADYPQVFNLFWPDNIYLDEPLVVPMNGSNQNISCRIFIKTYDLFFGERINNRYQEIIVNQSSGEGSYLYAEKTSFYDETLQANHTRHVNVDYYGLKGGQYPLFIKTDATHLDIISDVNWINIERRDDSVNEQFNFHIHVDENRSSASRRGSITFKTGDKHISLEFNQESGYATHFDVEKEEKFLENQEVWSGVSDVYGVVRRIDTYNWKRYYVIKIHTDGLWDFKFDTNVSWIKATKWDENSIRFQVKENENPYQRTATIVVSTLNMGNKSIKIYQLGTKGFDYLDYLSD